MVNNETRFKEIYLLLLIRQVEIMKEDRKNEKAEDFLKIFKNLKSKEEEE